MKRDTKLAIVSVVFMLLWLALALWVTHPPVQFDPISP